MKKKRNAQPEALLQMRVRRMLLTRAPADLFWIGGAAGIRLTPFMAIKAKAQGVTRRGWPDLLFLCPDGLIRGIELKADEKAELRPEQEGFRDAVRQDCWSCCYTLEQVELELGIWDIVLKPEVPDVGAYLDGKSFSEAFE